MREFPAEFTDLLSRQSRAEFDAFDASRRDIRRERLFWFPMVLSHADATRSLHLLERHVTPLLQPAVCRIPRSATGGMRRDYSEQLPKTIQNHSVLFNSSRGESARVARRIGLLPMMQSESLRCLAQLLTGFQLEPDPGCQVICYSACDYVGPHNDHHPQAANLRHGYVDFHLTISNSGVDQHWLIFEKQGLFTNMCQVGIQSGLSISFLPFWHYTTPLRARAGRDKSARRWLLLTSFSIAPGRRSRLARMPVQEAR